MPALLHELIRRDAILAYTGAFHVILLAVCIVLLFIDDRSILGINPWIKPAKFCMSIAIFLWTIAWFMPYAKGPSWILMVISVGISVAMITEIVCIMMQSARGTTSHFNNDTAFDAAVFSTMGIMILLSSLLSFVMLILLLRANPDLPPAYLWGIRLGFIIFLLGSAEAGFLLGNNAHTVGAPDGGAGLPFINWSREHGDLRIAHFVLLHGLQVLPVFGWLVHKFQMPSQVTGQVSATVALFLLYTALGAFVLVQALRGKPLIPL